MNQPILVEVTSPTGHQPLWTVDPLIEDLLDEGLDARLAYEEFPGGGAGPTETVTLWVANYTDDVTVGVAANIASRYAEKWLKHMARAYPEVLRRRIVQILLYASGRSRVYERIEMSPGDQEPVRHSPEDFESWTSKGPPAEGIKRKRFEPWTPQMTVTGQVTEEFSTAYEALVELARRSSYGDEEEEPGETVRRQVSAWQREKCDDSPTLANATIAALRYEITSKIKSESWKAAHSYQDAAEVREYIGDLNRGLAKVEIAMEQPGELRGTTA